MTSRLCSSSCFFLSAADVSEPEEAPLLPLRIDIESIGGGARGAEEGGGLAEAAAAAAAAAAALLLEPGKEKNDCLMVGVDCGGACAGGGGEAGGGVRGSVFQCWGGIGPKREPRFLTMCGRAVFCDVTDPRRYSGEEGMPPTEDPGDSGGGGDGWKIPWMFCCWDMYWLLDP